MNVVLLRIGIDTGSGGIHGPLFADGGFEYIPIPDGYSVDERTYGNMLGRHRRELIQYFPAPRQERMNGQPMHFDPEFESFTYGDPTSPKARLRKLEPGDLLVFYCGLRGWDFSSDPALYLMGYFEVEVAGRATDFTDAETKRLFGRNFHVRHRQVFKRQRDALVLVKGSGNSRLLDKAIRLSVNSTNRAGQTLKVLSPEMRKIFGEFGGRISIQRSPPRWVDPENVGKATRFVRSLGGGPRRRVKPVNHTRVFSYVITHDTGFAPNPYWGFCTLANCKPQIRRHTLPGDWVLGMGSPRNVGNGKLIYAMRVGEVLTFEQYNTDSRFRQKRPDLTGDPAQRCGDNIYFKRKRGGWGQRASFHKREDMKTDLGGKNVLVSSRFFYFGENAIPVPPKFRALVHKGRAHSCHFPPTLIQRFLKWLCENYEPGLHGTPSNEPAGTSVKTSSKSGGSCSPQGNRRR